ncbi:GNAT family N-acetyltransferase [Rubrobacter taiwanensis]|jgi:acetyltransferase|uniref:GNAT family N-acetyltransferase n=1 Tax=Rubrobacter taiwanensis TaxID=185139 RepID=A0A4V2NW56_9ACTN|nr:bifunctional acetate--CoA ligase family protein/GNAT family N-acetyltransferase [Rubrobacter taiwanensis]TCJ16012.1 GNAT family N-acetyltransferase [Rubrobacter taiwanensis]
MKPYPTPGTDPAHDILRYEKHSLDVIFGPGTVAVIGASDAPGSVGNTLVRNLIEGSFGGVVYPVNPRRKSVMGIRAYPAVGEVPEPVDLAVIATPAPTVPGVVRQCVDAGVKGAIVISAGFRETGSEGAELEERVLEEARRGGMRLIGPNCLGVMRPHTGFNATFAQAMALPGSVGFISQSGALLTSILDWSLQENVGFSYFVSIGSMLDVGWGDLIYYLGDDPRTKSIVLYMESVGDVRSFLSAAREVALSKPIIVIKAGRTEAAAKAAASHTGALTGSDRVLDAAFRRSGVLRVDSISDLFYMAEALSKQPRPQGPRLTIITNAGGPGVLATDALIDGGGELARLSGETMGELDALLPEAWSRGNPVDVLGDADPERYTKAVEIARKDPGSDGALVILTPQAMTDSTRTAEHLRSQARGREPILASWMGGAEIAAGREILNRAGIPTFAYPDTAARIFNYMWRYSSNLRSLYETPVLADEPGESDRERAAGEIIERVRGKGRTLLTEAESKQLLAAYGIPTVETRVAEGEDEAVEAAGEIGYPVVLKLNSETITHKTDVGGVKLDLKDGDAVRRAFREIRGGVSAEDFQGVTVQPMVPLDGYELIVGSNIDPQFGPVLLFGSGGSLVEVMEDYELGLPPLNTTLARRLMERTRIYRALQGVRGRDPVDLGALERLLVRFSQLVVEQPWIREIDINPLLASSERLIALDARVLLHDADTEEGELPRPAIRPYPEQYVERTEMKDGTPVTIRPIRPEDEPLIVKFHETLSEESVYMRYFRAMRLSQRTAHERLTRICFVDYDREMALVAERRNPETGEREILGVGRLSKLHGIPEAEFALIVSDPYQGQGLGTGLLSRLLEVGRREGLRRVIADILPQNRAMQRICKKLGFKLRHDPEEQLVKAEIDLRAPVGA